LYPFSSKACSKTGFLTIKEPLAPLKTYTLAGYGSIPAEQELILELETVGAIAKTWVFLIPVPLHQSGSPYSAAKSLDAASALDLMLLKIV
jgi:hypothetical protein